MGSTSREPKLRQFDFDQEKFKELILYIAEQCQHDLSFGAVKLNKMLYYADFDAYRLLGQPVTGATYRKLQAGPAPKDLIVARDELIDEGRVSLESRPYFNRTQKRLVLQSGVNANKEVFTPEEREIINAVIKFFMPMSAREASDYSHREAGWLLAGDREIIPYESAFLSTDPIDQETEETALRIGAELLAAKNLASNG